MPRKIDVSCGLSLLFTLNDMERPEAELVTCDLALGGLFRTSCADYNADDFRDDDHVDRLCHVCDVFL